MIDHAVGRVLKRLSDDQIGALARICERVEDPPEELSGSVVGAGPAAVEDVRRLGEAWRGHSGMTGPGVALALRVGLAGRRAREAARAVPVWTGPGAKGDRRLTARVLHELIADAKERVLLVSFAAFALAEVVADLQNAVDRGCSLDVVLETQEDSGGRYHGPGMAAFGRVSGASRWRWPSDQRVGNAVLHGKVLVVDGRRALVGSANLTKQALAVNIEAGVVINDPEVAGALEEHVRLLMHAGVLVRA